jgi:SAM-dependent methyltransferase
MIWVAVIFLVAAGFAVGGLMGAPYVPILKNDSHQILEIANLKPGGTLIDLGSGDGRLLRAAAARGVKCIGYEINPIMVLISIAVCWRYRKLVRVRLSNLWTVKLPPADVIYCFLMPKHMDHVGRILDSQITRPTTVICYSFGIPGKTPAYATPNIFAYDYGRPGTSPPSKLASL